MLSGMAADTAQRKLEIGEFRERVAKLTEYLERKPTSRGEIRITKNSGLFVARR